jgi:presenilin-like A22 family membrane protease
MLKARLSPFLWGSLILIVAQIITFYAAFREKEFVEANQIVPPQVSLELPLLYFFGAVVLLGIVLWLLPGDVLRMVFRTMFAFLFAWGIFITLGLSLPLPIVAAGALAAGLLWYFWPVVWLHNLLMIFTLTGVAAVFGFMLPPWTAVSFMLVISVYDVISVRFGYMLWMVSRLSQSEALPAFVIPSRISLWKLNLRETGLKKLLEEPSTERDFLILGGGDIGFPLMLVVSVFFAYSFAGSIIVAAFSLLGLISAFLIQLLLLKGKPMPALPPIALVSIIGFLTVYFT